MHIETQQKWLAIIAEQQASCLTVVKFCQQQQISTSTFYQRKRELAKAVESETTFVRATVTEPVTVAKQATPEPVLLTTGQVSLTLSAHTSADYLAQLIKGINA